MLIIFLNLHFYLKLDALVVLNRFFQKHCIINKSTVNKFVAIMYVTFWRSTFHMQHFAYLFQLMYNSFYAYFFLIVRTSADIIINILFLLIHLKSRLFKKVNRLSCLWQGNHVCDRVKNEFFLKAYYSICFPKWLIQIQILLKCYDIFL